MIEQSKINIQNKRVGYEFEVNDRYEASMI